MVRKTKQTPDIAERFLTTGATGGRDILEIANACDRKIRALTQVSAKESIARAEKFIRRTRSIGGEAFLAAQRCAGWAYLVSGKYQSARRAYLEARKLAVRQPLVRARIDRVLIDVYMYLGEFDSVRRHARMALATFRTQKADDDIARTEVNFANVLHRQDRHREAYRLYHKASTYFQARGNDPATALCWYNEANTLVQLFSLTEAADLYLRAREIFQTHNQPLQATGCLYGLAWLHMLEGKFHLALTELSECEKYYSAGKMARETVLCQLDRAESYLGLNLFLEARQAADAAGTAAKRIGLRYEQAKADFFAARALIGMGRTTDATRFLSRAEARFRNEKNTGFAAAAKMDRSRIYGRGSRRSRLMESARRELVSAQLPLWEAICDLQMATDRPGDANPLQRLAHNPAAHIVPHLAAHYKVILGDRAAGRHKTKIAIRHWTEAAELLDAVRASLPPIEMRSAFFAGHSDPFRKLIKTEATRRPHQAAVWAERYKTVGIWSVSDDIIARHPARLRVQDSLQELAGQVAAITGMVSGSSDKRSAPTQIRTRQFSRLREKVRQDLAALYAHGHGTTETNDAINMMISEASSRLPIVQFHVGDTDILAFVHDNGECRAKIFHDGVSILNDSVARWRFLMECAPGDSRHHRRADLDEEERLLAQIGDWLLSPLEISPTTKNLLIVPEGRLFCLPWPALRLRNTPLYDTCNLVLAPSIRHYLHSQKLEVTSRRADLFVGAGEGLPWLREEVSVVRDHLSALDTSVFDPCVRGDWPDNEVARIWHYAGHAQLRSDNPFYSALLTHDEPIFAADFRLRRNKVELVTLAACRTGQQIGLPGDEAAGLVRALLEMGARNVVAGGWAVSDRSTAVWMDQFYKAYMGNPVAPAAMRSAINAVREGYPSAYHWAAYSVFGAG